MASAIVTKSPPALVTPCKTTPSGTLPLSSLDKIPGFRFIVEALHVFKHGREPGKVIRRALARALVPYHPLAGRLMESDQHEMQVACTGEGVWFVEASADCTLEDVNYLQHPLAIPASELLPSSIPERDPACVILVMQVTEFTCGGFALCVRCNHVVIDATGQAQFLKAIGEMAQGISQPSVKPVWCREVIPGPPKLLQLQGSPFSLTKLHLVYFTLDISFDYANQMKDRFKKETGRRCSSFDVLVAQVWQCRTRAINPDPHDEAQLAFPASVRPLLSKVLPSGGGYYGNGIFPIHLAASCGRIMHAPIIDVVNLITEAKKRLPAEFQKWINGCSAEYAAMKGSAYNMTVVTDTRQTGLLEQDFGWGRPIGSGLLEHNDYSTTIVITNPLPPKRGFRLITHCVRMEHLAAFRDQMMQVESQDKIHVSARL